MGQYYHTILADNENGIRKLDNKSNFGEWEGLKLMEHSWIGNNWADIVAQEIYKHKTRVSHVGDYADEYPQWYLAYGEQVEIPQMNIDKYRKDKGFTHLDYHDKYFINWDKRMYITLNDYMEESNNEGWIVNPVTLLTALGNGRGGGDYWDKYPYADEVGAWSWDLISIEDEHPADFEEVDIYFKED